MVTGTYIQPFVEQCICCAVTRCNISSWKCYTTLADQKHKYQVMVHPFYPKRRLSFQIKIIWSFRRLLNSTHYQILRPLGKTMKKMSSKFYWTPKASIMSRDDKNLNLPRRSVTYSGIIKANKKYKKIKKWKNR